VLSTLVAAPQTPTGDITPIGCGFGAYCGGLDDWFVEVGVLFVIVILGGLIMRRWRDMPLVAVVSWILFVFYSQILHYLKFGGFLPLPGFDDVVVLPIALAILTLIAAAAQALKRGAVWLLRPRTSP